MTKLCPLQLTERFAPRRALYPSEKKGRRVQWTELLTVSNIRACMCYARVIGNVGKAQGSDSQLMILSSAQRESSIAIAVRLPSADDKANRVHS